MKIFKIITTILLVSIISMFLSATTGINLIAFAAPILGVGIANHLGIIKLPEGILTINFGAITTLTIPDVDGREAMGGYGMIAYLALKSDIATWPTLPDVVTETDVSNLAKLTGNFVMESNKYFYKVYVNPRKTQFTPENQGEVGGKSFKVKGMFYIPGIDSESTGLARLLNNKYAVLIIPDQSGTHRICIGTEDLPCEFAPTGDSGQAPADAKGFTFNFECDSFAPGWIYNGSIPLDGSTVDPIS